MLLFKDLYHLSSKCAKSLVSFEQTDYLATKAILRFVLLLLNCKLQETIKHLLTSAIVRIAGCH